MTPHALCLLTFTAVMASTPTAAQGDPKQKSAAEVHNSPTETQVPKDVQDKAAQSPLNIQIDLQQSRVALGTEVHLTITTANRSPVPIAVYNPQLNPLLMARQRPIELAILDANTKYIGDLLTFRGGSSLTAPRIQDWITLRSGAKSSATFSFQAGSVPGTDFFVSKQLPPGKYFIELRAHAPLISGPPVAISQIPDPEEAMRHPTYKKWCNSFPGHEICRSNRVELEILPRTGD